ncbi:MULTISPECIES: ATP-dependent DNA helicase RecG [unclassified Prochlorococcus]|uniref:ATP-dependent DNA helicase RecG n=1 Tax=unclassified Prochlorococcus TaxID=2627481 RepID=UPI00053387B2|nr:MULTISPECIES: ATP-dependent DNA helicase RecG [unclassified Prochlorococcus]KGG15146.1 ATP-dependent DNA helicase RecG [Prochlorococcus sp. MIT 0602]KGG17418.1 ATP-dependent DNA helicase RecG [Prochlorococcus sp. MIT 0603]
MVEEYSDKQTDKKVLRLINELKDWIRPLQQALTVEAENEFRNLDGRNECFNSFLSREIKGFKSSLFSGDVNKALIDLAASYEDYSSLELSKRRRLVIDTRKFLHLLSNKYESPPSFAPPKLKIANSVDSGQLQDSRTLKALSLNSSIGHIKGVGTRMIECFKALGIITVKDLLLHYPRDYVDYSALKRIISLEPGETATVVATIRRTSSFTSPRNPNLSILELQLEDITGRVKVTKFFVGKRFSNRSFLKRQESLYPKGSLVAISGLVKSSSSFGKSFSDPLIEILESNYSVVKSRGIGRILPIYHLTEGLSAERIRGFVYSVISLSRTWEDPLPIDSINSLSLLKKSDAIYQIHKPITQQSLKEAKRRLVFDEFLFLQLGLLKRRRALERYKAPVLSNHNEKTGLAKKFLSLLPFSLTRSQQHVLNQIESDLALSKPMSRLVQGDVGSGKTVVAIAALLKAVESGWQGAFMAPTEVLAHQHYLTLCKWMPQLHVTVELLTGSTSSSDRKRIEIDLATGNLKIIVGTHALIENKVSFARLGLVVVDEQHRFGVNQRNLLLNKGLHPHLLTMTATPIPRTLALSIHGDLDVSQITELPPGRTPIKTLLLRDSERNKAYEIIEEEIKLGRQAYVVLPLVDESDKLKLRSAIDVYHDLSTDIFSNYEVGLLHGRMNSLDKKNVINRFSNNAIQVLVSTTVIEVGVDVPLATVMVVDHADRFGLSQLHQLRGRVGRGSASSKCILIDTSATNATRNRLEVLVQSNDGFAISEIDLRLRGPGQVLGTRQSGLPDFALANLVDDEGILECARDEAARILKKDPNLIENNLLREMLDEYWDRLVSRTQLN